MVFARQPVAWIDDALTVIVPTRDEERNIPRFLGSLPGWVRLIVVDGSSDATAHLVRSLRPERTRLVQSAAHIAEARHIGADLAATRWLVFTDADVVFGPGYFERALARMRGAPAGSWYGPKLSRDGYRTTYAAFAAGQRLSNRLGVAAASGSNMVVLRTAYRAVGGFDPVLRCNEDSELGWRLQRSGQELVFAPELVVYATDHRRLRLGRAHKTVHSLLRCALLYGGLIPERWRGSDWGYWRDGRRAAPAGGPPEPGLGTDRDARSPLRRRGGEPCA